MEIYDDQKQIAESENTRKVFINLGVEDLKAEYNRIKASGIAINLTAIRYINVFPLTGTLHLWIRMEILSKLQVDIRKNKYRYGIE